MEEEEKISLPKALWHGNPKKREKKGDYIGAAVVNSIMIFVVNRLLGWNIPFITESFQGVLFALNLSLGAQIGGNLFLTFYSPKKVKWSVKFVFDVLSINVTRTLLRIFPFRFEAVGLPWLNEVIRIVLIVSLVVTSISAAVNLIKFIVALVKSEGDKLPEEIEEE